MTVVPVNLSFLKNHAVPNICSTKKPDNRNGTGKEEAGGGEETVVGMNHVVMRIPNFVRATVVNRPSKVIKSPYMADIMVPGR